MYGTVGSERIAMRQKLEELRTNALKEIDEVSDLSQLEALRVRILGRKGSLTEILRGLGQIPLEERRVLGQMANELKGVLQEAMDSKKKALEASGKASAKEMALDVTLPGRRPPKGHPHPVMQVAEEIVEIFAELGFQVASGPDVELEYYNFDSLNTPKDHPARDLHDTFFVKPGVVLRTQTSPVQMRVMEKTPPPVAIVAPGRVYRVDADATHSPMFYQIEGLLVDKGVSFADLKGTLIYFLRRFFGKGTKVRFRPHYFPFTEPSAEVDVLWKTDKGEKWLEILGCGMVHPEVFKYAKYDYEKYTGYAFGMGVDRIAMARYSINSIHYLYENDLRFLEQF